jgi:hypothetical protein
MKHRILIRTRYVRENDVTLFRGDCLALLKRIPNSAAQLVVTSPVVRRNSIRVA